MSKISAKAVDKTLIVVINKKIYNKVFATHEELQKVLNLAMQNPKGKQIKEIIKLMSVEKSAGEEAYAIQAEKDLEERKVQIAQEKDLFDMLRDIQDNGHDILVVKGNSVYMSGINISMPKTLVEKFLTTDISSESLVNFWRLCALNPDPRARQDLFDFLQGGKFTLTPNGYFVAYRNVALKQQGGDKELHDFVNSQYLKVKAMKKAPKNYSVVRVDTELKRIANSTFESMVANGEATEDMRIGVLDSLYHGPSTGDETVYTDNHTRKFTIKIGELVTMDRTKCDADPKRDCSYGLHVGNKSFLSGGSFGDAGLAVLVNPSKVIAVPEYNQNKMRVCEYLPIGVVEYDDSNSLIELETAELDFEYAEQTQTELEAMITSNSSKFEEYKKQELIPQELTIESLQGIVVDLNKINDIVKNRVQQV